MTDPDTIQALARQSLDQTVLDGSQLSTDPKSYIHGFMAGFATVEYSRNVLDDDELRAIQAAAWDEGRIAGDEEASGAVVPNPYGGS